MRVCLDTAAGRPWHETIPRPAIRHASMAQLQNAIAIAEAIIANPERLSALNRASLDMRKASKEGLLF